MKATIIKTSEVGAIQVGVTDYKGRKFLSIAKMWREKGGKEWNFKTAINLSHDAAKQVIEVLGKNKVAFLKALKVEK